jgi:hypothetical protein
MFKLSQSTARLGGFLLMAISLMISSIAIYAIAVSPNANFIFIVLLSSSVVTFLLIEFGISGLFTAKKLCITMLVIINFVFCMVFAGVLVVAV